MENIDVFISILLLLFLILKKKHLTLFSTDLFEKYKETEKFQPEVIIHNKFLKRMFDSLN